MPYIKESDREALKWLIDTSSIEALGTFSTSPGIINYLITNIIKIFLGLNPNYERFNAAIGVLECAKLELYRRMVAPYEDTKIEENGDVY